MGGKGQKGTFGDGENVIYLDLMVFKRCIHFSKNHWPCDLNGYTLLHANYNSIRLFFFNVKVKKVHGSIRNCPRLKKTKETSGLNTLHDSEYGGNTPINNIVETVDKI